MGSVFWDVAHNEETSLGNYASVPENGPNEFLIEETLGLENPFSRFSRRLTLRRLFVSDNGSPNRIFPDLTLYFLRLDAHWRGAESPSLRKGLGNNNAP